MAGNPLNYNQVMFVWYAQQALNAGLLVTKGSALSWFTTYTMAPWKTYLPAFFSFPNPLGPSYGSPSDDWDNLVSRGLLPTVAQPMPALTQWVLDQIGKN